MSVFSKVGHGISKGIGNVSGGVGGFLNDLLGSSDAAKQEYRYSQQAANADMQRSIYLWNMQNEYNIPAAQIARMKAAGIDVNPMTYAVGNGNMSTVAGNISAPGTGGAHVSAGGVNPFIMLVDVLNGIARAKETFEDARAKKMANDDNETSGTSDATSIPIKTMKQAKKAVVETAQQIATKVQHSTKDWKFWKAFDVLDDELSDRDTPIRRKMKESYEKTGRIF